MAASILAAGKYIMLAFALAYAVLFELSEKVSAKRKYNQARRLAAASLAMLAGFHLSGTGLLAASLAASPLRLWLLGAGQLVLALALRLLAAGRNRAIAASTAFLLSLGFLVQTRLSYAGGLKQLQMAALGMTALILAAWLYPKLKHLDKLAWLYFAAAFLLAAFANETINGATNWLRIGSFSFQPSEIVKLLFILYLSSQLSHYREKHALLLATGAVALLVGLLVFKRDLGSALIFYAIYILALYIETSHRKYIFYGALAAIGAGVPAYLFFSHVRVRVLSWLNPWADTSGSGYQIAQSLFAIHSGGLAGTGLAGGMPSKIPVVSTDFVFAAVVEIMGLFMGLLAIYMVCRFFLASLATVLAAKSDFDFMLAAGIAMVLALQSFLIIGGVIKMIPLTGVTLPLVSGGGTSMVMTLAMVGILQGIHAKSRKGEAR